MHLNKSHIVSLKQWSFVLKFYKHSSVYLVHFLIKMYISSIRLQFVKISTFCMGRTYVEYVNLADIISRKHQVFSHLNMSQYTSQIDLIYYDGTPSSENIFLWSLVLQYLLAILMIFNKTLFVKVRNISHYFVFIWYRFTVGNGSKN